MSDKRHQTWQTLSEGGSADGQGVVDELPTEHAGRYDGGEAATELGRGGLGRVVLVLDRHVGREVARKELLSNNPGLTASARFLREARVTACLEHPNVVPVYDLGSTADGRLFYTMKRIRGRTLRETLAVAKGVEGRLELLPHFVDACNAIAFAHASGIVHRDIKPDNVMVGEFGETLVVDWGLAKVRGEQEVADGAVDGLAPGRMLSFESGDWLRTQYGATLGTPAYMSPEQARGELDKIDERSDVWSLGAMLYEILAGHPPFAGESLESIVGKVREGQVPPIGLVTGAPPALCAIVDKALKADPAARYADAKLLARDVEAFLAGQRVAAYQYSFGEEVARWVRAHRELVAAALVGTVACGALSVVAFQNITAERDRAVVAEQALSIKEADTRMQLALALAKRAAERLDGLDAVSARALAARSLVMKETPEARGVLVSAASMRAPKLAWQTSVDVPCDALRVAPGGRWLACASTTVVHVWDLENAHAHHALGHGDTYGYGFSWAPDGRSFLLGGDAIVRWIDVESGAILRMLDNGPVAIATATLPNGDVVVGGDDGLVRVWDEAGTNAQVLAPTHGDSWVTAVAVSPDGLRIASIGNDKQLHVWDAASLRALPELDDGGRGGSSLAWGRGDRLASGDWIGDDDRVYLWDTKTGHVNAVRGSLAEVSSVVAPPNGDTVLSGAADGSVNVWNWDGSLRVRLPDAPSGYAVVGTSADGRTAFVSSADTVREWRLPLNDGLLRGHRRQVTDVQPLPDGSVLTISDDGDLVRWNPATSEVLQRSTIDADGLWGLVVSGDTIVVGSRYGNVYGLDAATFALRWTTPVGPGVNDLALSPDGASAVIADDGGVTRVTVADGVVAAKLASQTVEYASVAFCGDDLLAAANYAGRLLALDPVTLEVRQVLRAPAAGLADVSASADGKFAATADDEGQVHVWDWAQRHVTHTLTYGDESAEAIAFSPDGKWLVAGAGDGRVAVWSAPDFGLVARIPAHGTRLVNNLVFDGAGTMWSVGGDAVARPLLLAPLEQTATDAIAEVARDLGVDVVDGVVVPVAAP